jgi:hypothetical protein
MFTEYERQQRIEGINAPIWPRVFAPQNVKVFFLDLCMLDSELQCLVLYCVLLIPNYSFWFCTVSYWFLTTASGPVLCTLDSELQFSGPELWIWVFNHSSIVLICGTAASGPEHLTRVLSCGLYVVLGCVDLNGRELVFICIVKILLLICLPWTILCHTIVY